MSTLEQVEDEVWAIVGNSQDEFDAAATRKATAHIMEVIRREKAEAWYEGRAAGRVDAYKGNEPDTENPYREAT